MNLLGNNLSYLRKEKGLKQSEIADIIGVGNVTWSDYERGKSEPNISVLLKISRFFKVDINSILENVLSDAHLNQEKTETKNYNYANLNAHPTAHLNEEKHEYGSRKPLGIPLIPIEAFAGYTLGDFQVLNEDIRKHYYVPEFEEMGVNFIIQAKGSSMYPKYSSGDLLACKVIKESQWLQWGKVYVLDTEQGAIVKRLYQAENKDYIVCHSDNAERYPPFEIPKSSIRSMSIVVGVIRLE